MSDARLRELERRWRETGTVEDEAAWLRALLRAGRVSRDRLLVAYALGLEAAKRALGAAAHAKPEPVELAAGRCLIDTFEQRVRAGLAAAPLEAWARCPCEAHARANEGQVADYLRRARRGDRLAPPTSGSDERVEWLERVRAWCAGADLPTHDALAARTRGVADAHALRSIAAAFSRCLTILCYDPAERPARDGSPGRVAPFLLAEGNRGPTALRAWWGSEGRVVRLSPAQLLHERLPRWAEEGVLAAPCTHSDLGWIFDAQVVRRAMTEALPQEEAAELLREVELRRASSKKAPRAKKKRR